jgi:hypothetical protein
LENARKTDWKTLIDDLREQWIQMWSTRIDDKLRAEGIVSKDYSQLFVERGLIVSATKDFKSPEFADVIRRYIPKPECEQFIPPNSSLGGWGRFIKEAVCKKNCISLRRSRHFSGPQDKNKNSQLKKNGRGWLHY